uniref:Uncharacterized protein n=1 Tax=Romanomermis culicivorax TaxID=13658 RepID=A0A915JYU4_ROMCU
MIFISPENQNSHSYSSYEMSKIDIKMLMVKVDGIVTRSSAVNDIKKHILPKEWLINIEPEYTTFHDYLTSLYFDMTINYPYLNELFDKVMMREKITMQSPLDWESDGPVYNKIDKAKLAKLFKE